MKHRFTVFEQGTRYPLEAPETEVRTHGQYVGTARGTCGYRDLWLYKGALFSLPHHDNGNDLGGDAA